VAVLLIIATRACYLYWQRFSRLRKDLGGLLTDLHAILDKAPFVDSKSLELLTERFAKSKAFAHAWNEFQETLIRDDSGDQIKIYNTRAFSDFLTPQNLFEKQLHARSFRKLPTIITSLGLGFTFSFIVIGISGLHVESSGVVTGIDKLIGGLSAKFISSVTAIVLSVLITIFEDQTMMMQEAEYMELTDLLDRKFQKQTAEDYLRSIDRNIGDLSRSMKGFSTDLAEVIKEGLNEGMRPSTDRLLVAIENLEKQKSENVADTLAKMLEQFSTGLNQGANTEFKELGSSIQRLAVILNDSAERSSRTAGEMERLISTLGDQAQNQERSSGSMASNMHEGFVKLLTSIEENSKKQGEALDRLLSDTVAKTSGATSNLISQVENLSGKNSEIMGGFGELNRQIAESVASYRSAVQASGALLEGTSQTAKRLEETVEQLSKMQTSMGTTAEKTIVESKVIQEIQRQNVEAVDKFSMVFTVVESGLKNILEQLGTNLERYRGLTKDALENYLKQYDESLSKSSTRLSATVEDIRETLDTLTESLDAIRVAAESRKEK